MIVTCKRIGNTLTVTFSTNPCQYMQNLKEDLPGEQLVYVVAFAVGAQLMYADRPKDTTIQRLYNIPSLAGEQFSGWSSQSSNWAIYNDCTPSHLHSSGTRVVDKWPFAFRCRVGRCFWAPQHRQLQGAAGKAPGWLVCAAAGC